MGARASFNCFDSYGGERSCACIGVVDFSQLKNFSQLQDP
jgi:hypothetical protein